MSSTFRLLITAISFKRIDEMSLTEIKKDGFDSKEELWLVLKGFYPHLKEENQLMLVEFRCILN